MSLHSHYSLGKPKIYIRENPNQDSQSSSKYPPYLSLYGNLVCIWRSLFSEGITTQESTLQRLI